MCYLIKPEEFISPQLTRVNLMLYMFLFAGIPHWRRVSWEPAPLFRPLPRHREAP